jgi:hypothetical protein
MPLALRRLTLGLVLLGGGPGVPAARPRPTRWPSRGTVALLWP